jgi:hypothetical protein
MKLKISIFFIAITVIILGLSGCIFFEEPGPEVIEYFEEEYNANENTTINAQTINGGIEIISWDGESVLVNATKKSRYGTDDLKNIKIKVTENNNQISIVIQLPDSAGHRSVDLDIKVPYNVSVGKISSTNGGIEISEVKGNADVSTTNGGVVVKDTDGYVKVVTNNGGIVIENTTGIDHVTSTNGGIVVEIFDIMDDVVIQTTNGGVTAFINQELNANIDVTAVNSDISVEDLEISTIESSYNYLRGTLGEGGDKITISSTNGDINIHKLEL